MCAVDERVDPARGETAHDRFDRKDEPRRTGDVIDQRELRALGRSPEDRVGDLLGIAQRERHLCDDDARARLRGEVIERVLAGGIGVVGREQLVAGRERDRREDRAHGLRRVAYEDQVLGARRDEPRDRLSRSIDLRGRVLDEEPHRLGLHAGTDRALRIEYLARARSERPMVQERDRGIEREARVERRGHRGRQCVTRPSSALSHGGPAGAGTICQA